MKHLGLKQERGAILVKTKFWGKGNKVEKSIREIEIPTQEREYKVVGNFKGFVAEGPRCQPCHVAFPRSNRFMARLPKQSHPRLGFRSLTFPPSSLSLSLPTPAFSSLQNAGAPQEHAGNVLPNFSNLEPMGQVGLMVPRQRVLWLIYKQWDNIRNFFKFDFL